MPTMRRRPKNKPFFLWFAALDPHRDYVENIIPKPNRPADVIVPPYLPDMPEVRKELAFYYDEITRLDNYVGKVMAELEQQGVAENTLVLFMSDNGRPFPRAKTTLYESGIKTPLIVRWPRKIGRGGVADGLVSSIDIAPTILQLAGLAIPPTVQGKSFAAILSERKEKTRDAIYAEKNWHDYEDRARAVRTARFKYIRNDYPDLPLTTSADSGRSLTMDAIRRLQGEGRLTQEQSRIFQAPRPPEELYDVIADPHEFKNLAEDPRHAETLAELREKLIQWGRETDDRMPAKRTPDEFDRETGQPLPTRRRPRPGKLEINSAPNNK
jgi:N-sulfoglucosamine sulfohydrolase